MYGTDIITILSAVMPNCCAVTHCNIDSTTFFSYQNINRIFILCKGASYTISFIAHRLTECIHRTIILPVVLYVCETWPLTLREEHRLRIFENRVLRRIFGSKRGEVKGEWREVNNEELNDLYCLSNIVRVIKSRSLRWVGHVEHMGERRGVYRVLVGKHEGKRPLGRPSLRWENTIKMDLHEMKCGGMD
jgi:hypothetical protein